MLRTQVLIVEDQAQVARDTRDRLCSMGYDVCREVLTKADALTAARTLGPDVALVGVASQSKIDGVALARQFREELGIAVVYVTECCDDKALNRAKLTAPFALLCTPFDDRQLHWAIQMALHMHRIESELRRGERRCREIVEKSQAGYFRLDRHGRFAQVNAAWLAMHGYDSPDEVIGRDVSLVIPEDDLAQVRQDMDRMLLGEAIGAAETTRCCRDGTIGHHAITVNPVEENGKIIGIEGFLIDLTDREYAEGTLRTKQAQFSEIFDAIPDMLVLKDRDLVYQAVNRAFCEYVGKDEDEIIGATDFDLFPTDQATSHVHQGALAMASGKRIAQDEPDTIAGRRRWWHVVRTPIFGSDGQADGLVIILQDITARKQAKGAGAAARTEVGSSD